MRRIDLVWAILLTAAMLPASVLAVWMALVWVIVPGRFNVPGILVTLMLLGCAGLMWLAIAIAWLQWMRPNTGVVSRATRGDTWHGA